MAAQDIPRAGAGGSDSRYRIAFMAQTYEELKKKTIDELREIAKGLDHEAVKGYTQMNKDHLLPALAKALGIDTHVHHPHHAGPAVDKAPLKEKLRALKAERDKALEAHDHARLKAVRRHMHSVNRKLRAASA
jgi:hypothetical protein